MPFRKLEARMALAILLFAGCVGQSADSTARLAIEAAIARGVEATRQQDIEAYMALVPQDAIVRDGAGAIVTREKLRANALRDWSIIRKTLSIEGLVDSLTVHGDSATVFTSQRWERLMLQRDGQTTDTVLTTQSHREFWRQTPAGWFAYEIEELGGEVFINGRRFTPGG